MKAEIRIAKRAILACVIARTGWMIAGRTEAAGLAPDACKAVAAHIAVG